MKIAYPLVKGENIIIIFQMGKMCSLSNEENGIENVNVYFLDVSTRAYLDCHASFKAT